jgi:2-dehydropantoate 2-reductase
MRIAVFGTGGVGGYFGGRLAQAGEEVHFIARGEHLSAIRRDGLTVSSVEGDFRIAPARATDKPEEVGPVDAVIVGVKAWQIAEAAKLMRPLVGPSTTVIPLENGVEAADELAAVLGDDRVIGGLCAIVAMIEKPGHIRHAAVHPVIRFGELDNGKSDRVELLRQTFARAEGLTVELPEDIHVAIWNKFSFISAWSGVGSVTRVPLGPILGTAETRTLLQAAVAEAVAVGRAAGVALSPESVEKTMGFFDSLDGSGTASMQRDVMAGRPSELEAQTGAIVRLGARHHVPTPANAFLYQALLPQERIARGEA